MTYEAQRIAIAEACGWKIATPPDYEDGALMGHIDFDIKTPMLWDKVPDYLNDLNAIHKAEQIIPDGKWKGYVNALRNEFLEITNGSTALGAYQATATQRAEAFLRTLNLWTP